MCHEARKGYMMNEKSYTTPNVTSIPMSIFTNKPELIFLYLVLKEVMDAPLCGAFNSVLNRRGMEISGVSTLGKQTLINRRP